MGTVFKGLLVGQAGFQRPLVIKQVRNPAPDQSGMFVEEARRYALLDHENIGRIFDFEEVRGEPCIILEYIDGWTLVEYLERHRQESEPPDVELCVFIASRVCRALQYVFERAAIVHRDISPSNIMMTSEGTVKLIDFGIATRSGTRDSAPHRQALLHGPGDGGGAARRQPQRPLQPGGRALRDADPGAALPGQGGRPTSWSRWSPGPSRASATATPRCPRRWRPSSSRRSSATRRGDSLPRRRWARPASTSSTTRATGPRT